ncbi:MAG: hypothetical protein H6706_08715 [Myxococcales bacterium]|nr:hypothetical protein [Myxococcales bacterium]
MLRRLLVIIVAAGLVWAGLRVRAWLKARTLPVVPDDWRLLAEQSLAFGEALDLRDRMEAVVRGDDRRVQRALLLDVHGILHEIAQLVRLRFEVERHLHEVRGHPPGRRAGRPLPEDAERQRRETAAALEARADRFATEAAQAVSGLRQVYLELLETHDGGRGGGAQAARKTRALIDSLRSQAQAEQEISRFLQEDHKDRDD